VVGARHVAATPCRWEGRHDPADSVICRAVGLGGLIAAVVFAGPASGQERSAAFERAWAPVRAEFRALMESEQMVGGSLMFFHGDTTLAMEFHGFADLATRRPVDAQTIYHWASITKTFTAIALLQLRDRGRIGLDDPIVDYLPELRMIHDPFGPVGAITLRLLLSHAAGFRAPTWPWETGKPWEPFAPTQWSQIVAMMPYTEVLFPPGSRYQYSNLGYVFIGKTIEAVSGDDYEVYVDKNLFKPLGMTSAYFDRTPYHLLRYRSNSYVLRNGQAEPLGLDFDTGVTVSNGGLNAPLPDMIKYLQFLAGVPGLSPDARAVLDRKTLEEMWRPLQRVGDINGDSIGLGFYVTNRRGIRLISHHGGQAGFKSFFYVDPATGAGAIAAFNTIPADGQATADPRPRIRTIFTSLLDRLVEHPFALFAEARLRARP
jgi:CubicO group peptidase (beta-lactamase class C family)